ncbi:PIG-L family deacetylase [Candidatus Woesearchaeota archaeon]|nr:PIG-L family deacetylase [Candidatus Woesearchaeota archaeon]
MAEKSGKILIICAHPDDEIIGCGGTIAKFTNEGKKVHTLIFSFGESSHPWLQEDKIKGIRIKESESAGKIVGTESTEFIGVWDGAFKKYVQKNPDIVKKIKAYIKKINPDKIFTHSFDDVIYYDHKITHNIVMQAIEEIKFTGEIYTFNIWNPLTIRKRDSPKLIVDITNTFTKKVDALKCFKSQKVALVQLTPVVYIRAFMNGLNKGFRFAEEFSRIK